MKKALIYLALIALSVYVLHQAYLAHTDEQAYQRFADSIMEHK